MQTSLPTIFASMWCKPFVRRSGRYGVRARAQTMRSRNSGASAHVIPDRFDPLHGPAAGSAASRNLARCKNRPGRLSHPGLFQLHFNP